MTEFAKLFILIGVLFIVVGCGLYFLPKVPGLGRLPGDIFIKKENFTFYFPLTTSILLSIIISLILMLWAKK